jgi:hypothetical protein
MVRLNVRIVLSIEFADRPGRRRINQHLVVLEIKRTADNRRIAQPKM